MAKSIETQVKERYSLYINVARGCRILAAATALSGVISILILMGTLKEYHSNAETYVTMFVLSILTVTGVLSSLAVAEGMMLALDFKVDSEKRLALLTTQGEATTA